MKSLMSENWGQAHFFEEVSLGQDFVERWLDTWGYRNMRKASNEKSPKIKTSNEKPHE